MNLALIHNEFPSSQGDDTQGGEIRPRRSHVCITLRLTCWPSPRLAHSIVLALFQQVSLFFLDHSFSTAGPEAIDDMAEEDHGQAGEAESDMEDDVSI